MIHELLSLRHLGTIEDFWISAGQNMGLCQEMMGRSARTAGPYARPSAGAIPRRLALSGRRSPARLLRASRPPAPSAPAARPPPPRQPPARPRAKHGHCRAQSVPNQWLRVSNGNISFGLPPSQSVATPRMIRGGRVIRDAARESAGRPQLILGALGRRLFRTRHPRPFTSRGCPANLLLRQ